MPTTTQPAPPYALGRPLVAVKPLTVPTTDRPFPLHVKVTAPTTSTALAARADGQQGEQGERLPVVVLSHGNAWSMDGYTPLADRWATAGAVVVQPTHLDSRRYGITPHDPRFATIWRQRFADLRAVIDHLPDVLADAQAAGAADLVARADTTRVAVVGHSWGAQSAGALLGARVLDADGQPGEDLSHPAVRAGALLAAAGTGESLTDFAAEHLPFMRPDFTSLAAPTLVVAGDRDQSGLSTRGPDWFTDAHRLAPGAQRLLTVAAGEHTLGGLAGEAVAETTDEDPARVALVADAVWAHLRAVLDDDPRAWDALAQRAAASGGAFATDQR